MFRYGFATVIISNEEMEDMKIVKSIEDSGLLTKGANEAIKNEANKQKGRFIGMPLENLGASLLGNHSAGKGTNRAGEGTIGAGKRF